MTKNLNKINNELNTLTIRTMFQELNGQLQEINEVVEECKETLDLQEKINNTKDLELLADYIEMLETV